MTTKNNQTHYQIAKSLIKRLRSHNIDLRLWYRAKTGSVYLRFACKHMGSVRIGDHDGYTTYKYKWNMRSDITSFYTEEAYYDGKPADRYYFPVHAVDEAVQVMAFYYRRLPEEFKKHRRPAWALNKRLWNQYRNQKGESNDTGNSI